MPATLEHYEIALAPYRTAFSQRMAALYDRGNPALAALFLMHYSAQGVGMTKDVPSWIRAAGSAAEAGGYSDLGRMLVEHANHEDGHHEMMERDVDSLVAWWNARFERPLSAAMIRKQGELPAVAAYRQLHLDLARQAPYAQIAVEFEIERLSVDEGPKLFRKVIKHLDLQVLRCLSFLTEHVAIDAGHTRLNKRALGRLIAQHPETLAALVSHGKAALETYAAFLEGCTALAAADVAQHSLSNAQRRARPLRKVIAEKAASIKFLLKAFVQGRLQAGHHT